MAGAAYAQGQGPGEGSDLDFRATSQLASRAVPTVSEFARGDIAYYWNPAENRDVWRTVGRPWVAQEDPVVQIGVLNEFADVDVTGDLSGSYSSTHSRGAMPCCIAFRAGL